MSEQIFKIHMGKAKCALDLGDGSERGEYVDQDYILNRCGRPHRAISLMYCYYPYDEGWPVRASLAHKSDSVGFAWDYPYDDYFPYTGGLNGDPDSEVFRQMRDIRRHGQDVLLTLTIDPHVTDDHLIAIAKDLRSFGRVMLRLNHEATGNWFSFNKRCTYQEVADFFVRASRIIRETAPNVKTIICIGGIEDQNATQMVKEAEFAQTIPEADIWSVDKYMALHWGWPYDIAETGGQKHRRGQVSFTYDTAKKSFQRFKELNNGQEKPMFMSEFNADGDVTGPYDQCKMTEEFVSLLKADSEQWLRGISFYQFRDRGRLGLEIEDPNNKNVGIEQPMMSTYRAMLKDPYFSPEVKTLSGVSLPVTLRYGGAEDAEGLSIPVTLEANPHFCEAYFKEELQDLNLMLMLNGKWFYKAPGVSFVDFMPAFFEKPLTKKTELSLQIFTPPASGENEADTQDGLINAYTELKKLPRLRILYRPVEV